MKRTMIVGLLAGALLVAALGGVANAAGGPQPLPNAACNQGTASTWTGYFDNVIPHWKDWDGDGESACYHFNPNYPPGGPGLE